MDLERRLLSAADAEVRIGGAGSITGHAAVFNSMSEDLGGFREIILPGAFSRALAQRQDVTALFNHNPDLLLGRTTNGTLTLSVDSRGLLATISPPPTPTAEEVRTLVRGGYLTGMSFAFRVPPGGESWRDTPEGTVRHVADLDLYDVSVVTTPAYLGTSVSARARPGAAGASVELLRLRLMLS